MKTKSILSAAMLYASAVCTAQKIKVKQTKLDTLKRIVTNFFIEQQQLLEQYERELADYNKAIGASPSGVAAAAAPPTKELFENNNPFDNTLSVFIVSVIESTNKCQHISISIHNKGAGIFRVTKAA